MEREIPKYRKRKKQRSPTKSKHKHDYHQVLVHVHYSNGSWYSLGFKCSICSKVKVDYIFITEPCRDNCRIMLSDEQILKKYGHLELVEEYL